MKLNIGNHEIIIDETTLYIKNPSSSTSPALQIEQLDTDQPLLKLIGTAASGTLSNNLVAAREVGSISAACYVMVEVQDDGSQITDQDYFLPLYTLSSSEENVSDAALIEWTEGADYEMLSITWDGDGVISSATVKWPDGSSGTFTRNTKNTTWLAIDAYEISHTNSGKTVVQSDYTRDSDGFVITKPALTISYPE